METTLTTDKAYMIGYVGQAGSQLELDEETVITFPYNGMLIAETCLNDLSEQGKGHGKELYLTALNQFGVLYSVFPVSDDAFRVHDSLIRSGKARREFIDETGLIALIKC